MIDERPVATRGTDAESLRLFSPAVAGWFGATFGQPTPPQAQGWPVIARGDNALIISPTGSGKTLTAFLWSLDRLFREGSDLTPPPNPLPFPAGEGEGETTVDDVPPFPRGEGGKGGLGPSSPGVRVLYISPLKALNNDVERNLRVPLAGIRACAARIGQDLPEVRAAVRTGDTPMAERQKMLRQPPHVLITTPESLYLMLTSPRARTLFATTHTVIVDEIHTLVSSKRGAHLALSLERLERIVRDAGGDLQRVGLSATVRPTETAARFLGGQAAADDFAPRPVTVVDAVYPKALDLRVCLPFGDFVDAPGNSVWATIVPEVSRLIDQHKSTLVFANSRRLAERTADRLNEHRLRLIAEPTEERPRGGVADLGIFAAGTDSSELEAAGVLPIRAHHGSVSKAARFDMETALKAGGLPALVATSSLELGIDIGDVDLVVQLEAPKSVAAGLQRVGRSGHRVGQTSVGRIFPTHADDLVEAAAVAWGMLRGEIESSRTPENPLDVLAQQIVAAVAVEDLSPDDLYRLVRGAYPYATLTEPVFRAVLEMLSGKYPEALSRQLRARISWDRVNDRLTALPGSAALAIGSGGTIPDRGSYALVTADRRTRIGDLDEEFVFETRAGDTFLLGSNVWRVVDITTDRVIVEPAPGEVPRMPFWRGDTPWRPYDLGKRVGRFRRELASLIRELTTAELSAVLSVGDSTVERVRRGADLTSPPNPLSFPAREGERAQNPDSPLPLGGRGDGGVRSGPIAALLRFLICDCALDRAALVSLVDHVARQLDVVGELATDREIVVETFTDAIGDARMVVHSPFGGRVNGPWGLVLAGAIRERLGIEAQVVSNDDGILIRFADAEIAPPTDLVTTVTSGEARERLLTELPGSAIFGAQFRMNAARSLLLPRERAGKRTPLWLTRMRAKDLLQAVQNLGDFPILLETFRDCLRDVMDLDGLTEVLDGLVSGSLRVVLHEAEVPSPVAVGLDYRLAMQFVYEYDQPRGDGPRMPLPLDRDLLNDLLRDGTLAGMLDARAVAEVRASAGRTAPSERARGVEELAQLLYELGDLSLDEARERSANSDATAGWLSTLAEQGRAIIWRFGESRRYVHAERVSEYEGIAERPEPVLRRHLAHAGPTDLAALAERYAIPTEVAREALVSLGREVAAGRFTPDGSEQWVDRRNLEQMHRRTLGFLRREVRPVPLAAYAAFLGEWQGVGPNPPTPLRRGERGDEDEGARARALAREHSVRPPLFRVDAEREADGRDAGAGGTDALRLALQRLRGIALPAPVWERDVLPARVSGFDPGTLADLCGAGDLMWVAEGGRDPKRARVRFFFRGEGGLFLPRKPSEDDLAGLSDDARAIRDYLAEEGAVLFADVAEMAGLDAERVRAALVELVLAGLVTNDSIEAIRAIVGYEPPAAARQPYSALEAQLAERMPNHLPSQSRWRSHDARRRAQEAVTTRIAARRSPWVGRWALVHRLTLLGKPLADDERASRQARQLLLRWGVVTKACLERESAEFEWGRLYPVLVRLEARGEVRRGYFVEGLPGIQFAAPEAVDRLRAANRRRVEAIESAERGDPAAEVVVLSAADPAQLFGAEESGGPLRFTRVATTAVAAWHGEPVAAFDVAVGGGSVTVGAGEPHPALVTALGALGRHWLPRVDGRLRTERWGDEPTLDSAGAHLLEAAGWVREAGAMRWVGR